MPRLISTGRTLVVALTLGLTLAVCATQMARADLDRLVAHSIRPEAGA